MCVSQARLHVHGRLIGAIFITRLPRGSRPLERYPRGAAREAALGEERVVLRGQRLLAKAPLALLETGRAEGRSPKRDRIGLLGDRESRAVIAPPLPTQGTGDPDQQVGTEVTR